MKEINCLENPAGPEIDHQSAQNQLFHESQSAPE
jgi:hypothetical protein